MLVTKGMKLLRSSPVPGVLERMKTALETSGIQCLMRNQMTSGLLGEVPVSESIPELWVVDDASVPSALEIVADLKASPNTDGKEWECPKCGEVLEPQFTSCWKCDADIAKS